MYAALFFLCVMSQMKKKENQAFHVCSFSMGVEVAKLLRKEKEDKEVNN